MKSSFSLLLVALVSSLAQGFVVVPSSNSHAHDYAMTTTTLYPKKYPAGKPFTGQVDEDMAMWFEDKKTGQAKQALKKPVGGRPNTLYTKKDIETIEKKGVDPLEKFKAGVEFLIKRPTRGY